MTGDPQIKILSSDTNIQKRVTDWKTHNPNDGSNIGGVMPANYGLTHEVPDNPGMIELFVEGASFATAMAYCRRSIFISTTDSFQLDFDVYVQDDGACLLETDTMICIQAPPNTPIPGTNPVVMASSIRMNMSLQNDFRQGGQLQMVNTSGKWINIPNAKPGVPTVGKHHYTICGTWNAKTETYGFTSLTIDDVVFPVTQSAPGEPCNWSPMFATIQFQITNKQLPAGVTWGSTSILIDAVNFQLFASI